MAYNLFEPYQPSKYLGVGGANDFSSSYLESPDFSSFFTESRERHTERGMLDRTLDFLSVGQYAVQGAIHGILDPDDTVVGSVFRGIRSANPFGKDYTEGEYTFGQNLESIGWRPTSGLGKFVKGTVGFVGDVALDPLTYLTFGAEPIFKGTGTVAKGFATKATREGAEKFTRESAEYALKKAKGIGYKPAIEEVDDLVNRVNKLRGVVEPTGKGLGFYGDDLIFNIGEKIGLKDKRFEIISEQRLRQFGDNTIAPYFNLASEKLRTSKLFGSKRLLIDLARTEPSELIRVTSAFEEFAKKGIAYEDALTELKNEVIDYTKLDDAQKQQILELLEDKSMWKKVYEDQPLKGTKEGAEAYQRMQDFIIKYGDDNPEMAKLNKEVMENAIPKFEIGEDIIYKSKDGDFPVTVTGVLGHDAGGTKYYSIEGSNVGIPENLLERTEKHAKDMKIQEIKEAVETGERGSIDLTEGNEKLTKEEFVRQFMNDQKAKDNWATTLMDAELKIPRRFKNPYDYRSSVRIAPSIEIMNNQVINTKTGQVFGNEDILTKPLFDVVKQKGFHPRQWGKVSKQTTSDIQEFFIDMVSKDEILSDIFEDLLRTGKFNSNLPVRQIKEFMNDYYKKDAKAMLDKVSKGMHRYHSDYPMAREILANKYPNYKSLSKTQRFERMQEMYQLLNDPQELNKRYADLTLATKSTKFQFGSEFEVSFSKSEKALREAEARRIQNRPDYVLGDEYRELRDLEREWGAIYKDGKKIDSIEFLDDTHVEFDGSVKSISELQKEGFYIHRPSQSVTGTSTKKVPREVGELTEAEKVTDAEQKAFEQMMNESIQTPKVEGKSLEESLSELPQDFKELYEKPSNARQELINKKLTEYRDALESEASFERYMKTIWGQEKLDKVKGKGKLIGRAIDYSGLDEQTISIAKDIKNTFSKIGKKEIEIGKLTQAQFDANIEGYLAHVLTPEGKAFFEKEFTQAERDALGLKSPRSPFGKERKIKGTVGEINKQFKELLDGNKLLMDDISDVYLARMQSHYKLMYEDGMIKDIQNKFGQIYEFGMDAPPNNKLVVSAYDFKKLIGKEGTADYKANLKLLGITKEDINMLGTNNISISPKQADWIEAISSRNERKFGKSANTAKAFYVNEMIIDKANELMGVKFAEDTNALLTAYDKFLRAYKIGVTALRPAFHANNIYGNAFNNYLNVGSKAFSPIINAGAMGVLKDVDGTVRLAGKEYTFSELREQARIHGVIGSGFFGKDIKQQVAKEAEEGLKKKNIFKRYVDTMLRTGSIVEEHGRLVNFLANLDNGLTYRGSARNVDKFLFDYGDVTKFENDVMRRIFPFYTWMKNNMALQLSEMATNPRKYMPIKKAIGEIEGNVNDQERYDKEKLPEWAQNWIQLTFTVNEGGVKKVLFWGNNLPYTDLEKLPNLFKPLESVETILSQTSPFIKVPMELAINRNFFLNKPIDSGTRVLDPTGNFEISPYTSHLLQNLPLVNEAGKISKVRGISSGFQTALDLAFGVKSQYAPYVPVSERPSYDPNKPRKKPVRRSKIEKLFDRE